MKTFFNKTRLNQFEQKWMWQIQKATETFTLWSVSCWNVADLFLVKRLRQTEERCRNIYIQAAERSLLIHAEPCCTLKGQNWSWHVLKTTREKTAVNHTIQPWRLKQEEAKRSKKKQRGAKRNKKKQRGAKRSKEDPALTEPGLSPQSQSAAVWRCCR